MGAGARAGTPPRGEARGLPVAEINVAEINVAEINMERKQRGVRLWIAGLLLLVLVLWGVALAAHHGPVSARRSKATATDASSWDNIPPRLRQYA
jgi:hypothetical protein